MTGRVALKSGVRTLEVDPRDAAAMFALNWETLLATKHGWRWDARRGVLRCPEGKPLTLTTVSCQYRRARIYFRGGLQVCHRCPVTALRFQRADQQRAEAAREPTDDVCQAGRIPGEGDRTLRHLDLSPGRTGTRPNRHVAATGPQRALIVVDVPQIPDISDL